MASPSLPLAEPLLKPTVVRDPRTGREVHVLGIMHISRRSIDSVAAVVARVRPDTVALELCRERAGMLFKPVVPDSSDVLPMLTWTNVKNDPWFYLDPFLWVLQLNMLSMEALVGVRYGGEQSAGAQSAAQCGARVLLVDRSLAVTQSRIIAAVADAGARAVGGALWAEGTALAGDVVGGSGSDSGSGSGSGSGNGSDSGTSSKSGEFSASEGGANGSCGASGGSGSSSSAAELVSRMTELDDMVFNEARHPLPPGDLERGRRLARQVLDQLLSQHEHDNSEDPTGNANSNSSGDGSSGDGSSGAGGGGGSGATTAAAATGEGGGLFKLVEMPLVKERDAILAYNLAHCGGQRVVAVLGAAHVPGVVERLRKAAAQAGTVVGGGRGGYVMSSYEQATRAEYEEFSSVPHEALQQLQYKLFGLLAASVVVPNGLAYLAFRAAKQRGWITQRGVWRLRGTYGVFGLCVGAYGASRMVRRYECVRQLQLQTCATPG